MSRQIVALLTIFAQFSPTHLQRLKSRERRESGNVYQYEADDDLLITDELNKCGENYTGKYSYYDQACPCGKYKQGSCKSGIAIPIWTNEAIDDFIDFWSAHVAYNRSYTNVPKIELMEKTIGGYRNMHYIGDPVELFPAETNCVRNCTADGRQYYDCECKCGLREAKLEMIKSEGVVYEGMLNSLEIAGRGITYALILIYFFMGVAIVADKFMDSIEMITSQEREVTISVPGEGERKMKVRIWNETVSNLTLMALGSSAPEILLAVVETFGNGMKAGALGPATIVGSAAFNLFMIISLCMYVIPDGEKRRIKHLRVFFVTATWSVLAYVWLYFIVVANSPEIVEPWEALVTLLFFPLLTVWAWIADKRLLVYDYVHKKYQKKGNVIKEYEGDEMKVASDWSQREEDGENKVLLDNAAAPSPRTEQKSRAYYRKEATRMLMGQRNTPDRAPEPQKAPIEAAIEPIDLTVTRVQFSHKNYRVAENCGNAEVSICRKGPEMDRSCWVDFTTMDGTALAGSDYERTSGTLNFQPNEQEKKISIPIIDDDIFELDEYFQIALSNLRVKDDNEALKARGGIAPKYEIGANKVATITILDDDHRGCFAFDETQIAAQESCGHLEITVIRKVGSRGPVVIPFRTVSSTAKGDVDFESIDGELQFDNEETEKSFKINIIDQEEYEKDKTFFIELGRPTVSEEDEDFYKMVETNYEYAVHENMHVFQVDNKFESMSSEQMDIAMQGVPQLDQRAAKLEIRLTASKAFRAAVDKMAEMVKNSAAGGGSNGPWAQQFADAVTISADDDDDEDAQPGVYNTIMHFVNLPWKVIFAFIPPIDYFGGSLCFIVSIAGIGILTAFIGDFASHFGCTVGVTDAITAISFVALGTSVPDTFASKLAAINDDTADASIGNVTGSNAVNVFLGIGLPWSFAAIYWVGQGKQGLEVKAGTLSFAVMLFCIEACFAITILMLRRKFAGGELGGPRPLKIISSISFVSLWLFYLAMSTAKGYCKI